MEISTARDKEVLKFLARWRFCTVGQLQKAGIFKTSRKKCYNRLLVLRRAGLIKAGQLPRGELYYYLTPLGGEVAGLAIPWYSRWYKNARTETVVRHLVQCDFALAAGIDYLTREEVLGQLMDADYGTLAEIFRSKDLFFQKDGRLHTLIIDYHLTIKYLQERLRAYSRLPPAWREKITVVVLVFNEVKREQVKRAAGDARVQVKILKADWKY